MVFLGNHFSTAFHNHEPVCPWRNHTRSGHGGQEEWAPPYTDITRLQKRCCAHCRRDLLGFPFLFLEGLVIPYCKGRRCCPLAFVPAEKGPVEDHVPSRASPGDPAWLSRRGVAPCPPRALGSWVHSGLFPFTHPETVGAVAKPHMTCAGNCCNTLARGREPFHSLPGTSYNRSCQLPGQAGRGAARGALPAPLPARGALPAPPPARRTDHRQQSSCFCFTLHPAHPCGAGMQPWRVAQLWVPLVRFQAFSPRPPLRFLFVDP